MPWPLSQGGLVTDLVDRQLSRATAAQCLAPAKQKERQLPRIGLQEAPSLLSALLWAQSSFLEPLFPG